MPRWFLLSLLLLSNTVCAQEVDYLSQSGGDITQMLSTLKASADSLSVTNAQLNRENEALRQETNQWQLKLGQLRQQGNEYMKVRLRMQENSDALARQIAQAQKDLFDAQSKNDQWANKLKEAQDRLAKLKQEEVNINEQLAQIEQAPPEAIPDPVENPKDNDKRKEKINLLKMIAQSQDYQMSLTTQLAKIKPQGGHQPELVQLLAQRELLQARLVDLKQQLVQTQAENAQGVDDSDDLKMLSHEMMVLEKNYDQLRSLWTMMQEKAQRLQMDSAQQGEKNKLTNSLGDLNREAAALKAQLQDFREQMVDLDKRKTHLQRMLMP